MKMCILEDTLMIPSSVIGDLSLQSQFKQKLLATIDSVLSDGVPPNAGIINVYSTMFMSSYCTLHI